MNKSIVLTGARCTGKTEKGKYISERLNWNLIDGDVEINYKLKLLGFNSISELVKQQGWSTFRSVESKSIEEICQKYTGNPIVFTPGGGAVAHDQGEKYRRQNVSNLRKLGVVFYIVPYEDMQKSAKELTERLMNDHKSAANRPSLTGKANLNFDSQYQEMLATLQKRDKLYREAAHHTVLTRNMTSQEAADMIYKTFIES